MTESKDKFSLKDHLFNKSTVRYLANQFQQSNPTFPDRKFVSRVLKSFPELELKQRIAHIADVLHDLLPGDYLSALDAILAALPPELDPDLSDDDFGEFIIAPLGHFVAEFGCDSKYRTRSLAALKEITKRFSAEDPIRAFINKFPKPTLKFLLKCARDKNYHVRRWASEGTRPSLPWSGKLVIPYTDPIPILDTLFADPKRYVTRSVANHLNDISKLDAPLVISKIKEWKASRLQSASEMDFICKHSLRTLVAQGNRSALKLLGFGQAPKIEISNFQLTSRVISLGESVEFSFDLYSRKQQKLAIDFVMTFASKSGKPRRKVFKLKQLQAQKEKSYNLTRKHPMKPMTTRKLYSGTHEVALQINGRPFDRLEFELIVD